MGNCCSGGEESKKASAFQSTQDSDRFQIPDNQNSIPAASSSGFDGSNFQNNNSNLLDNTGLPRQDGSSSAAPTTQQGEAQLKAEREEQNRLDLVVQMAGRGMVSVRSTRGSTGYYDQGFAAALGQHLEQTTKFPDTLPIRLPPTVSSTKSASSGSGSSKSKKSGSGSNSDTVFARLAQPQWENISLGKKGTGLAGCDGENPNTYMDHVAVSFLDSVVPKKERIFHGGVGPMVENLL